MSRDKPFLSKSESRSSASKVTSSEGTIAAGRDVVARAEHGGTAVIAVNIGITLEQYETGLRRKEKEVRAALARPEVVEKRSLLERELAATQTKLADLEATYEEQKARLAEASRALQDLKEDVAPEQLKRAQEALGAGFHVGANGVTNYLTLLDEIERSRNPDEPTLLVTFNYDTLLDRALDDLGVPLTTIEQYVSSDRFKLIKVHGSVNWVRKVTLNRLASGVSVFDQVIDRAADLPLIGRHELVGGFCAADSLGGSPVLPALAIPVQTKQEYECPAEHLQELRKLLPRVDKLLVIGWRANEQTFLKLLAASLQSDLRGMVVSGNETESNDTANRLNGAGINGVFQRADWGFTDLIKERPRLQAFLKQ